MQQHHHLSFCILHSAFCIVSAVAATAAMADTDAPATFAEAKKAIAAKADEFQKARMPFMKRIAAFEELRATEPYSTNYAHKADIDARILSWCQLPGWTSLKFYDRDACTEKGMALCRAILASDEWTPDTKNRYAEALAGFLAGELDYAGAEKVAREQIARVEAQERPNRALAARAWLILADVYRWQDRAGDMVAAIEKARQWNILDGTRGGCDKLRAMGGSSATIDQWWREVSDTYQEALYFADKEPARCRKAALDYVLCATNPLPRRFELVVSYFTTSNDADARQARRAIGREDLSKSWNWRLGQNFQSPFQHGDYQMTADLFDDLCTTNLPKNLATAAMHRMRIISLGAIGRKDEAVALAKAHEADEANKPLDTLRYQIYAAILSGKDALPIIEKSGLSRDDRMAATRSAARQCQVWEMTDEAERYANAYVRNFSHPAPKRVAKVVWSDTPVNSVAAWRAIADKLEVHHCDLPFTGNLDFMETDVATGREKIETAKDEKTARMEFTTVADRDALHIFLRVADPEARLVESGFKGGVGTEMYFAAGANQAYTCFGSNPRDGVTFAFQTSYSSADHKRLDITETKGRHFSSEVAFTDEDYVLRISFPWDDYYQKLPSPNASWKYECMAWCPDGGFTWSGSIGIHNVSRWGTLEIALTPKQLAEVRRGVLFRAVKGGWRACRYPDGITLDYFDKWADPEIGDPGFYAECLKPLQEELEGYAARVKADMTDVEVNDVFEKGLVRMKGLKYEIDRLRREYLARKMTE